MYGQSVAIQFLRGLMAGAPDGAFEIPIILDQDWMPSWPLEPKRGPDFVLRVTVGVVLDMRELVGPSPGGVAEDATRRRWRLMPSRRGVVNLERCCKLSDLLISCCPVAAVRPLCTPAVWGVTSHIDWLLERSVSTTLRSMDRHSELRRGRCLTCGGATTSGMRSC